jgi:aspartyl-tRNA(Asn)/glutamyl-tRNA(Gln) amidotransferase subunit C
MTEITKTDIKKLAQLAKLKIDEAQIPGYLNSLSSTMNNMIAEINKINTDGLSPSVHASNTRQRFREDIITESNQRQLFHSGAPHVEVGLYMVSETIPS